MKEISDVSIDAIIADPPYGTTACKWDSVIDFDLMWKQLNRIIKPNGAIVLFGSEPFSSALRMSNIKNYKYDWIWKKNKPTGMLNAKRQPMRNLENIIVFYNKQCTYNFIKEKREYKKPTKTAKCYSKNNQQNGKHNDTKRIELPLKRYPTTIQSFDVIGNRKNMLHPTQKPILLMEYLIRTYTNENETVLDFTMGSGTTGVSCKNTNRNFIGIEQEEKHFEIAEKRIKESKQQTKLF
jgi:DNA modification methylase